MNPIVVIRTPTSHINFDKHRLISCKMRTILALRKFHKILMRNVQIYRGLC